MKNYSIRMIRNHMENIPHFPIPDGFAIRNYRQNEGHIWTRIQKAAEPYINIDEGLFEREFNRDLSAMEDRSFYLTTDTGKRLGQSRHGGKTTDGDRFIGSQFIRTIRDADSPNR